jgi:hypothetical protein
MPAFRLSGFVGRFKVAVLSHRRPHMKTAPRSEFLDNTLFLLIIFTPVSVLLAGALALAMAVPA